MCVCVVCVCVCVCVRARAREYADKASGQRGTPGLNLNPASLTLNLQHGDKGVDGQRESLTRYSKLSADGLSARCLTDAWGVCGCVRV